MRRTLATAVPPRKDAQAAAIEAVDPDIRVAGGRTVRRSREVGVAERAQGDAVQVSSLACLLEAEKTIAQVLFFRSKSEKASFRAPPIFGSLEPELQAREH